MWSSIVLSSLGNLIISEDQKTGIVIKNGELRIIRKPEQV